MYMLPYYSSTQPPPAAAGGAWPTWTTATWKEGIGKTTEDSIIDEMHAAQGVS